MTIQSFQNQKQTEEQKEEFRKMMREENIGFPKPIKKVESKYEKAARYLDKKLKKLSSLNKLEVKEVVNKYHKFTISKTKKPLKKKRVLLIPKNKLEAKAVKVFNAWIRNRDKERGCYALEVHEEKGKCFGSFQCCHMFSSTKHDIKFDEFNCNGGCSNHNFIHDHAGRPQPHIYYGWFIKKYGLDKWCELKDRSYLTKKFTREELLSIIKQYSV